MSLCKKITNIAGKAIILAAFCWIMAGCLVGCGAVEKKTSAKNEADVVNAEDKQSKDTDDFDNTTETWDSYVCVGEMPLSYASQFCVKYYAKEKAAAPEYALISIEGTGEYLLALDAKHMTEGKIQLAGLPSDVAFLGSRPKNIYLAATSGMDYFLKLNALDKIGLVSVDADGWDFTEVKDALGSEEMYFVGKYSAPDYEAMLEEECDLAIESTMIFHKPEVKEQIERLGIPVLVEHTSYEEEPLGRLEWIKLYGLLTGKEEEAEQFFEEQCKIVKAIEEKVQGGRDISNPSVAFFYVTSNGAVNVRRPNDYVVKMIETAGGRYVFDDLPEEASTTSTVNMQMEAFFEKAVDADILIYNGSIETAPTSVEELLAISPLFGEMKAVKEGNVWSSGANMFQATTAVAQLTEELHAIVEIYESGVDGEDGLNTIQSMEYFFEVK